MLKRIVAIALLVFSLSFFHAGPAAAAAFKSYVNSTDGYQFSYPTGWVQVKVDNGPDVVFHDIIERTENISVVISPVPGDKSLPELGTPSEVGYKLSKNAIAPENSGRQAELVNAESREVDGKTYYLLEYSVKLPNNQKRHNLASVAVSRGKLFTFNASVPERRWQKLQRTFDQVVTSFAVY